MIGASGRLRLFLRSFLIQGSWNHRTLMGTGMAWALLPFMGEGKGHELTRSAAVPPDEPFNTHPYLSCVALGALARGGDPERGPDDWRRFRYALGSPLGSLGDRLIWGGWRPFCVVSAMLLASVGVRPAIVVTLFLVLYNAPHLALRAWGLAAGLKFGIGVGRAIESAQLSRISERVRSGGVLVVGSLLGVLGQRSLSPSGPGAFWVLGAAIFLLAGVVSGERLRRWAPTMLLCIVSFGLLAAPILGGF